MFSEGRSFKTWAQAPWHQMGNKHLVSPAWYKPLFWEQQREKGKETKLEKRYNLWTYNLLWEFAVFSFPPCLTSSIPPLHFSSFCYRVCIRKQARVCFPTEARLFWVWCCSLTTSLTYCSPVPQPDLLLKVVSCLSLLIHPVVNYTLGSAHNNPWISLGQGHGRWLSLEMIPATRPPATQSPSAQAVMGRNIFCVIPQILHTYTIEPINVSFNIPFYVKILC